MVLIQTCLILAGDAHHAHDTGVDCVDGFIPGPAFATVGNFSLYKLDTVFTSEKEHTVDWAAVVSELSTASPDRRSRYIFLQYSGGGLTHQSVFNTLQERFRGKQAVLCCG